MVNSIATSLFSSSVHKPFLARVRTLLEQDGSDGHEGHGHGPLPTSTPTPPSTPALVPGVQGEGEGGRRGIEIDTSQGKLSLRRQATGTTLTSSSSGEGGGMGASGLTEFKTDASVRGRQQLRRRRWDLDSLLETLLGLWLGEHLRDIRRLRLLYRRAVGLAAGRGGLMGPPEPEDEAAEAKLRGSQAVKRGTGIGMESHSDRIAVASHGSAPVGQGGLQGVKASQVRIGLSDFAGLAASFCPSFAPSVDPDGGARTSLEDVPPIVRQYFSRASALSVHDDDVHTGNRKASQAVVKVAGAGAGGNETAGSSAVGVGAGAGGASLLRSSSGKVMGHRGHQRSSDAMSSAASAAGAPSSVSGSEAGTEPIESEDSTMGVSELGWVNFVLEQRRQLWIEYATQAAHEIDAFTTGALIDKPQGMDKLRESHVVNSFLESQSRIACERLGASIQVMPQLSGHHSPVRMSRGMGTPVP